MSGTELLRTVVLAETLIFVMGVGILFGRAAWASLWRRRWRAPMERARAALRDVPRTGRADRADVAMIAGLPLRLRIRLFAELLGSLTGAGRRQLQALAREVGLTAAAERMCGDRRWWVRLRGVRLLTLLGAGERAVPPLLRDREPAVRDEAVEWVAENPTAGRVDGLVALLAEPAWRGSYTLRDSLVRLGPAVVEPLARYLETAGGVDAEGALQVAGGVPDARFGPAAHRLTADADPLVRARAAALLGALGGETAVEALERLLGDADAEVRAEAAASLGRLGHWPAAPSLARLLRDRAWVVRSRSALALRGLGAPGLLLLRRGLEDPDPFAADIARQVLDLPGTPPQWEVRP